MSARIAPLSRRGALAVALAIGFVAASLQGCGSADSIAGVAVSVPGLPLIDRRAGPAAEPTVVFGPVTVDVAPATYLLVGRIAIRSGAVSVVVRSASGAELCRRSVARVGPSLVMLPMHSPSRIDVTVVEQANTGDLDADVESLMLIPVSASAARARASELAAAFERDTGRMADPVRENLVDNADFAEDDEVRGTPKNWFAYVPTTSDALSHTLHVAGTPPLARPAAATGPVAVTPGKRYRLTCRARASGSPITVRVVDYDELSTLAEAAIAASADGDAIVTLEFTPPERCFGARVQFAPERPGAAVDFSLTLIQLEELP